MIFSNDRQRRAIFAQLSGGSSNRFAAIPKAVIEDINVSGGDFILTKGPSALGRDKFQERPVLKTKVYEEVLAEEVVPRQKRAVGVTVGNYEVKRDDVPITDKYREQLAQYLSEGVSYEQASEWVKNEELSDRDEATSGLESKYYTDLVEAYEKSGAEDFLKYKKRFNKTYTGRKFSRKSKRDFDAVYERGGDDYVCSYCGDGFSSKLTAAIHAGRCGSNSFADEDFDFGEDSDANNDGFTL